MHEQTAPDTVHHIPLAEIDPAALPRDRGALDEAGLLELRLSIAASGLRQPVELWTLSKPRGAFRYGLLSGYRRLHAYHGLHELTGQDRYTTIPAFLRAPASFAAAMTAMVEENEIRADISPWERGRIAWLAYRQEVFGTIEEAVAALYPSVSKDKRARLRAVAYLVDEFEGHLTAPEQLSLRQLLRLSAAVHAGFGPVIRAALEGSSLEDAETQWQLIHPYLLEAEQTPARPGPRPDRPHRPDRPDRPDRPRRLLKHHGGLIIRRERTRDGFALHFLGEDARDGLLDSVFDEIERMFRPATPKNWGPGGKISG